MSALRKRVYFVGSSGTGKTTLARHVSHRYGLSLLPSAARAVLKEFGTADWKTLMRDRDGYADYQRAVFKRQCIMEAEHAGASFVSDRAFDNIAYQSEYGRDAWKTYRSDEFKAYVQTLVNFDPTVESVAIFHVRPTREVHAVALADGERKEYLDWEAMQRFDGMIKFVLETEDINYIPISTPSLAERIRLIDGVMAFLPKR